MNLLAKKNKVVQEHDQQEHDHSNHFHQEVFSWMAPEYLQHPKSVGWWVWAGVLFVIAAVLEFISGNYTMLAATVTFAVVYVYLHEHHPPKHTKITISNLGIKIGRKTIPYADIISFWIFYDPPRIKTLNVRVHKGMFSDLVIELEDQDTVKIRNFLLEHLPEWEGKREHISDLILRLMKL